MMGFYGRSTIMFENPVFIGNVGTAVGEMENKGKLHDKFDTVLPFALEGKDTWEDHEVALQKSAIAAVLMKTGIEKERIQFLIGGDLINQLTITNLTAECFKIPFWGLYNACATMAESMLFGSILLHQGWGENIIAVASGHNATSERQYRFPTELGVQRPQTAQWTVTGAGAMLLSNKITGIRVVGGTVGKVIDLGLKDANQMGAAMASAVFDSLKEHFQNTSTTPKDYDCIISGDLGYHGHKILCAMLKDYGYEIDERITDCGMKIYEEAQDTHSGGSGPGCSAVVWSTWLYEKMKQKEIKTALLAGSGALLSPVLIQQGKTIPAICHVVALKGGDF